MNPPTLASRRLDKSYGGVRGGRDVLGRSLFSINFNGKLEYFSISIRSNGNRSLLCGISIKRRTKRLGGGLGAFVGDFNGKSSCFETVSIRINGN